MSGIFTRAKNWYTKYERPVSSVALVGGFVWNALVLKRVDLFWENFWVVIHILIIAVCIVLINRQENKRQAGQERGKIHFWFITILQFTLGGLLSTFLVFYFRSATLAVAWPFILILLIAFIANERFKHHYERLTVQISVLYLSLLSFSIFIVPVVMHQIGEGIFILSSLVSLVLLGLFLVAIKKIAQERFVKSKHTVIGAVLGIFVIVNALYFFDLIPPIPLALKDSGVYHSITRDQGGTYLATTEPNTFWDYFSFITDINITQGEPVYVFSAIFSPTAFHTNIVHEWQLRDEVLDKWVTMSRIPLAAAGGRADGYRTYSKKNAIVPGKWRVNVETTNGQIIGRIGFVVHVVDTEPTLISEVK